MSTDDFSEHKKNIENIRFFAKELGKAPDEKIRGVGIPSFAVETKGKKIDFGLQGSTILGKKIEKDEMEEKLEGLNLSLQSLAESTASFSLNEDLNPDKIKEKTQLFMLALMTEEDFASYLLNLEQTLRLEVDRFQKIISTTEEKNIINNAMEKYQEALRELKLYLQDNRQKHFSYATKLLSSAGNLLEELKEKTFSSKKQEVSKEEKTMPEFPSEYSTKKLPDIQGFPSEYTTKKLPEIRGFSSDYNIKKQRVTPEYTTKKLPDISDFSSDYKPTRLPNIPGFSFDYTKKPSPSSHSLSGYKTGTASSGKKETQNYMISSPAPVWHSHYREEGKGKIKGYDLAYLSSLFKNLTFKQLDDISEKISLEKFDRGHILFREREDGNNLYIIKTGKVLLYKSRETEETEKEILTVSTGELVGEISAMDGGAYAYSAKIYTEGTILASIAKHDFNGFINKYPWLLQNLNSLCALRLRDIYNRMM